jgi:hypothetical protein
MTNEIKFDDLKYRREAEEFQEIRARLQAAVRTVDVPDDLESRIRASLLETPRKPSWNRSLMSIAAGVAVVMGMWLTWQLAGVRNVTIAQQKYVLAVSQKVATIMRVGLQQHIHCAVFRPVGKPADARHDMVEWLADYKDLLPVVRAQVPASFELLTAHKCKYRGREFVHFQFQDGRKLLSLMIVHKRDGESFQVEGLLPALVESGLPMYNAGVQGYQMTGFESRDHLAYVISNMPSGENTRIAAAMAPVVKATLARIEG